MTRVLVLVAAAAVLAACSTDGGTSAPPASTAPRDYTVVAKTLYRAGDGAGGKSGYYVTMVLFGMDRETAVSAACYRIAQVGAVLPERPVASSPRTVAPGPGATREEQIEYAVADGRYQAETGRCR